MAVKKRIKTQIQKNSFGCKTVLICGQTGSGKTTIAKEFISPNVKAKIGNSAKPCTRGINYFPGSKISVFDSEGYEIGTQKQIHYRKLIFDGFLKRPDKARKIQGVWYVISGASKRFTKYDSNLIKEIRNLKYPVAVLLTKIDEMTPEQIDTMKSSIRPKVPVFCLSSNALIKQNTSFTDWNKLEKWTLELPLYIRRKKTKVSNSCTYYSGYSSYDRKNYHKKESFNTAKFILYAVKKVISWW